MSNQPINRQKFGEALYEAEMINRTPIQLYAPSLGAARQKAIEHFCPRKRELPTVKVRLSQEA